MEATKRRTAWWIIVSVFVAGMIGVGMWLAGAQLVGITFFPLPHQWTYSFETGSRTDYHDFGWEGLQAQIGPIGLVRMNRVDREPGRRFYVWWPENDWRPTLYVTEW